MATTPPPPRNGVPWPAWVGLGVLLLALAGVAGWRLAEEPAEAAEELDGVAVVGPPAPVPAPEPAPALAAEPDAAVLQLAALDAARAQGTALADEVSRLRWTLLDERRQCVPAELPPPILSEVAEDEPAQLAEASEPEEPGSVIRSLAPTPEPPAAEAPEPAVADEPEPVVIAEVETPDPPVEVAAAPPPPPPPAPAYVPVREQAPPPPPPPAEPVVVAEAPPPQVAATATTPAAPPPAEALPGCPPPRPPEEAPEVVFVLDGSGSMDIPYGAAPGIDQQIMALSNQGPSGMMQAQQLFQSLLGGGGPTRMDRARDALVGTIRTTPPDVDMGFISFHNCGDVRNFGYYGPGARGSLASRVAGTQPGDGTPLADGMIAGGSLIRGGRSPADPAYMVVVSDGADSCGGDPCAVAQRLKSLYPGLIINVIDLSGTANLQCVANATGGRLVQPGGNAGLTDIVRQATGQANVPAHCLQGR